MTTLYREMRMLNLDVATIAPGARQARADVGVHEGDGRRGEGVSDAGSVAGRSPGARASHEAAEPSD